MGLRYLVSTAKITWFKPFSWYLNDFIQVIKLNKLAKLRIKNQACKILLVNLFSSLILFPLFNPHLFLGRDSFWKIYSTCYYWSYIWYKFSTYFTVYLNLLKSNARYKSNLVWNTYWWSKGSYFNLLGRKVRELYCDLFFHRWYFRLGNLIWNFL